MSKTRLYSAISYVAAALFLSGTVLANPADLSGINPDTLHTQAETEHRPLLLALNDRTAVKQPGIERPAANEATREAFLEAMQDRLRDALTAKIDADSVF